MSKNETTHEWPPKKSTWGFGSCLKRIEALLFRRELVWLRDYDGRPTLSVARRYGEATESGYQPVRAPRFWPNFRPVNLNEDGTAEGENATYVVQWIPKEEKAQLAAFIKNHEVYSVLPED